MVTIGDYHCSPLEVLIILDHLDVLHVNYKLFILSIILFDQIDDHPQDKDPNPITCNHFSDRSVMRFIVAACPIVRSLITVIIGITARSITV